MLALSTPTLSLLLSLGACSLRVAASAEVTIVIRFCEAQPQCTRVVPRPRVRVKARGHVLRNLVRKETAGAERRRDI